MGILSIFRNSTLMPIEKVESLDDAVMSLLILVKQCGFSMSTRPRIIAAIEADGDRLSELKAVLESGSKPSKELCQIVIRFQKGAGLRQRAVQDEINKFQPSLKIKLLADLELVEARAAPVLKVLSS